MQTPTLTLYRYLYSGHCHRVQWFLHLLGLPHTLVEVNLRGKVQKEASFLQLNPFGQVPVLRDGEVFVADSNAILLYLAESYGPDWLPVQAIQRAELQRWLSIAAGPLAFGPAAARGVCLFKAEHDLVAVQTRAHNLFKVMNAHLETHAFLLGESLSLADVANYAYVARAPEGEIVLDAYPHITAWLQRLEATPSFVGMPQFPTSI